MSERDLRSIQVRPLPALVYILALLWGAAVIFLTYPGYASFDTAYQWWMARHHEISTLWPPSYIYIIAGLESLAPGHAPTVLFVLTVALFALACASICARFPTPWSIVALSSILFMPAILALLPHIWSDIVLGTLLLLVVSLLYRVHGLSGARRAVPLILCLLLMILAIGTRHNAIAAVLPLLWWWACSVSQQRPNRWRAALLASLLGIVLYAMLSLLNTKLAHTRSDTWAITALWDLQAISVQQGRLYWPQSFMAPTTTIESARASFDPINAVSTYVRGNDIVVNSTLGLNEKQTLELRKAWLGAVLEHPLDYIRHRFGVMKAMLGNKGNPAHGSSVEYAQTSFRDNPVRLNVPRSRYWVELVEILRQHGLIHAGASILFFSLGTVSILGYRAWRNPSSSAKLDHVPTLALLGSIVGYLASLWVAAPTADLRYLFWPMVACWAALMLTIKPTRKTT